MTSAIRLPVQVGNIVTIEGVRGPRLVVRSERIVSGDQLRGDIYSVNEFDVVKFNPTTKRGSMVNPKISSFYFDDGSMSGTGAKVAQSAVRVVGEAKLSSKTSIEYTFTSAKITKI